MTVSITPVEARASRAVAAPLPRTRPHHLEARELRDRGLAHGRLRFIVRIWNSLDMLVSNTPVEARAAMVVAALSTSTSISISVHSIRICNSNIGVMHESNRALPIGLSGPLFA